MKEAATEVDVEARGAVLRRFQKVRQKLDSRLTRPLESVRVNKDGEVITFGVATGAILAGRAKALRQRLQRVNSIEQLKRAHRARLAAKRLRYVLDPVRSLVPGGRDAVSRLKGLQDVLGDLRDLQTLEAPLGTLVERAMDEWSRSVVDAAMQEAQVAAITKSTPAEERARAVAAAVQRVRSEQRRLFGVFDERWLGGHADPFFMRMERISTFLDPSLTPAPEPEEVGPAPQEAPAGIDEVDRQTDADRRRPIENVNWVFARQPDPPMPRKRVVRPRPRPSGREPQQAGD
jgi:CHAD domain